MYLSREAINSAQKIELPNQEQIFTFTEHDKKVWQIAFNWYNEHLNKGKADMNIKPDFSKVFLALKKAKEFPGREEKI